MFSHLLIPLDGSSFSEAALPYALSLAQKYNSELTLMQVIMPPQWMSMLEAETPEMVDKIRAVNEQKAVNYLNNKVEELRTQGFKVNAEIRQNEPVAEAILEVAAMEHIDGIVMSTHGRSGIDRWVFGSVAERVVHHATVPVLLIRAQQTG